MTNASNFSNSSLAPSSDFSLPSLYWEEPLAFLVVRLLLEVAIVFFGVVGNIMVCVVLSSKPPQVRMNTAIKNFVRNLAVADLGMLVMTFPFSVVREQSPFRWLLGKFTCLYIYPLFEVFYGVSIWSITAVAIERYKIINGARYGHLTSAKAVFLSIASIWLLSFLVVAFPMLLLITYNSTNEQCNIRWPQSLETINPIAQLYTITVIIFWFCLPLGIICWTYYKIAKRITQSVRVQRSSTTTSDPGPSDQHLTARTQSSASRLKQNERARRLLTPLVLVFVATMLPSNVFRLLTVYIPKLVLRSYLLILYNIFVIVTVTYSAANPVVYCLVSREFRQGLKLLIRKCLFRFEKTNARVEKNCCRGRARFRL